MSFFEVQGMHISEGVLPASVLFGGAAIAIAGTAYGLKRLDNEKIPQAGMLAASFFVASLIHVPLGVASVHLVLNGLVGVVLGWGAFPVIMVALLLQSVFFQFGGLTTLGINTVLMATPAVFVYFIFSRFISSRPFVIWVLSFLCGFLSVLLATLIMGMALLLGGDAFQEIAALIVAAHLPVMVVEGIITAFCIRFLIKVQPSLLNNRKVLGYDNI